MQQNTSVRFELQEYVLPTFTVELEGPETILPTTKIINIRSKANYVYGKPVEGTVTFRLGVKGEAPETVFFGIIGPRKLKDGTYTLHFNTSAIKNHAVVSWFPEIEGSYLIVEATVLDEASGKREVQIDSTSRFASSPYKISFKRCLQDFRPGLVSIFEMDVKYTDGRPAPHIPIYINASANGEPMNIREPYSISDEEGKVAFTLHPEMTHSKISVTVKTQDSKYGNNQAIGHFSQKKFISNNNGYIALERITGKHFKPLDFFDQAVYVEPSNQIADIYYVVTSRGKILLMEKLPQGLFKVQRFSFRITYEMIPEFRVTVFAHHQDELIADSLKINVENKCHENAEVKIKTEFDTKEPGTDGKFIITGSKGTLVGLLGVDEAVYALSKKDLLTKSKMFKTFGTHDFGCGPGGGSETNSVLHNAGIIIATNKYTPKLKSHDLSCEEKLRRKRSVISFKLMNYEGLEKECCALGMSHDLYNRNCEERTAIVIRYLQGHYENCSKAFLHCCQHAKQNEVDGMKLKNEKLKPLGRMDHLIVDDDFIPIEDDENWESKLSVRSDFREIWFKEDILIGADQRKEFGASLPHSITTWVVHAVSLSPTYGMCVADSQKIISFKKAFIQLNLPYAVVRNEQIEIQATVFNYGSKTMSARVYMYGVKDICTGVKAGEKSEPKKLVIEKKSAKSVTFPIIPLKIGTFDIKIIAYTTEGPDIIQKKLNVIPEGFTKEVDIAITLDPSNQQKRRRRSIETYYYDDQIDDTQNLQVTAVRLAIPENFIPGTESCVISALGDQMGPVIATAIQNPEALLVEPGGCGEQNMMRLAPTLYVMRYLKVTGRIDAESEDKGYKYIRDGYGNQLTYRKEDGSYAAYPHRDSSTWLTAFVAKVFCQANELVYISENNMCSAIQWLVDRQQPDGSFVEVHKISAAAMMGGVDGVIPITAFVLIALEECKCNIEMFHINKARAMSFLEGHLGEIDQPLDVAIVAYALALSDSELKEAANVKLLMLGQHDTDANMLHWSTESCTRDIETTSYALLTQLLFNDMITSKAIVNWLNTQRLSSGTYSSTQDTVITLQALSEYAIMAQTPPIQLVANITSSNDRHFQKTMAFDPNNALVLQTLKVDKIGGMLFINTAGHGVGLLSVKMRYNLPYLPEELCKFDITVNVTDIKEEDFYQIALNLNPKGKDVLYNFSNDVIDGIKTALNKPGDIGELNHIENSKRRLKIDICIRYLGNHDAGMSIVDAGIFTGFIPDRIHLDNLKSNPLNLILNYETYSKGVIFYLDKIPIQEKHCFNFYAIRDFYVGNIQTSVIKVYDYYNPDESCSVFYSPNDNSPLLKKICSDGICQCAEGGCPPKYPFESIKDPNQATLRAKLLRMACENYDYVWKGRLNGEIKKEVGFLNIPFKVEQVIKEGIEENVILEGDTRLMLARDNCESAKLLPNVEYLIMGKDGPKFQNEEGKIWHRYLLDATSGIHMWTSLKVSRDQALQRALNAVMKTLKDKGCNM